MRSLVEDRGFPLFGIYHHVYSGVPSLAVGGKLVSVAGAPLFARISCALWWSRSGSQRAKALGRGDSGRARWGVVVALPGSSDVGIGVTSLRAHQVYDWSTV